MNGSLPALMFLFVAACLAAALLKAWHDWLDLKRFELTMRRPSDRTGSASSRIELADLRERVRRLEAISDGIDPLPPR